MMRGGEGRSGAVKEDDSPYISTGVADDVEAEHLHKNGRGQMGPQGILGGDCFQSTVRMVIGHFSRHQKALAMYARRKPLRIAASGATTCLTVPCRAW